MIRFFMLGICLFGTLSGTNVATQTITFSVKPISEIAVSGDPFPLVIDRASAGIHPTEVVDTSTFYALTTNGTSEKVLGSLDSCMPPGTLLCIWLRAPNGATSLGTVDLNTSSQNLVTNIGQVAQSNLQITYIFESLISSGVLPYSNRVVTFTLSP